MGYILIRTKAGHCTLVNIRQRSDYIIGSVTPAIGPNKFKKLTRLIAPVHNIRGKVWMKNIIHGFTDNMLIVCEAMCTVFHSNFAAQIVCRHYRPCEFLGFVWTDCWGDKSNYVITSLANIDIKISLMLRRFYTLNLKLACFVCYPKSYQHFFWKIIHAF